MVLQWAVSAQHPIPPNSWRIKNANTYPIYCGPLAKSAAGTNNDRLTTKQKLVIINTFLLYCLTSSLKKKHLQIHFPTDILLFFPLSYKKGAFLAAFLVAWFWVQFETESKVNNFFLVKRSSRELFPQFHHAVSYQNDPWIRSGGLNFQAIIHCRLGH